MAEARGDSTPIRQQAADGHSPSLRELDQLTGVTTIWYRLGLQLGVGADDLNIIEKNYPRDADMCKIKMFDEWLRGDPNPTYEKLVRALTAVGKRKLAESVCSAQDISPPVLGDTDTVSTHQSHGSTGSAGGDFPHDITTQSGLTHLYNQPVTKVEHFERSMDSSGKGHLPGCHKGVRVTTASGEQYLVHKGPGFGKSGQTVVVDAKHMSDNWKETGSRSVSGKNVSDFVQAGGQDYHLLTDNCWHAAARMTNLGD